MQQSVFGKQITASKVEKRFYCNSKKDLLWISLQLASD